MWNHSTTKWHPRWDANVENKEKPGATGVDESMAKLFPASLEAMEKTLEGKVKSPLFLEKQTEKILEQKNLESTSIQISTLKSKVSDLNLSKFEIQEAKFINDVEIEEIEDWSKDFEFRMTSVENISVELQDYESYAKSKIKEENFRAELDHEKQKYGQKLAYNLKLAESKQKEHIPLSLRNYQNLRYQNLLGLFLISTDFLACLRPS